MMQLLVILLIIFVIFAVDLYLKLTKEIKLLQQAKEDFLSLLEQEREKSNSVDEDLPGINNTQFTITIDKESWNRD